MPWFLVANDIVGSVSGLLGAGLGSLHGTRGYSAWSWIFFIEGRCDLLRRPFSLLPGASLPQGFQVPHA